MLDVGRDSIGLQQTTRSPYKVGDFNLISTTNAINARVWYCIDRYLYDPGGEGGFSCPRQHSRLEVTEKYEKETQLLNSE